MADLSLTLFGAPRVLRDGAACEFPTRKAVALLAFLAVTGKPHRRDTLAALFWPDADRARADLRNLLWVVNRAIGEGWLEVDRETVALPTRAGLAVDVIAFEAALRACVAHGHPASESCPACLDPLSNAVALAGDDFLAGFTLSDSADWDEWQFFQTEHLRRELALALEKLVQLHRARREWPAAIRHAHRWLALDPLHEEAHRQLMWLLATSGQRQGALRQYERCVRILDDELGVLPLAETTALHARIASGQVGPEERGEGREESGERRPAEALPIPHPTSHIPHPTSRIPHPASRIPSPLVGRAAEWAALHEAARAGAGRLVVIEGEAGIGKTRLAETFLAELRARGTVALAARCYEGEAHLAYGPFVAALSVALETNGARLAALPATTLGEAARLVPALAALRPDVLPAPPLDGPGARSRFLEAIGALFGALGEQGRPAALFLDDLHWADSASLELLAFLLRRLDRRPLLVLATWRSEAIGEGHPLRRALVEAGRAGHATVLPLRRLDGAEVAALLDATAPDLSPRLGARLYQETEGLPFFVTEYLAALASGALAADGSAWPLPDGARDLLRARLAATSETGRQLLGAAATIGRAFGFDLLRAASGRSEEEVVEALEGLVAQRLIHEADGATQEPTYDFSHEKLRALAYEACSLPRRRLLHRRVAEGLARGTRGAALGTLAAPIAHHFRLAGEDEQAAAQFRLAGDHARALYANAEALAHFQAALALGHPDAAALHEAIGDVEVLLGRYGAAVESFRAAMTEAGTETQPRMAFKLGHIFARRGAWAEADAQFRAAWAALGDEGSASEGAMLLAAWSHAAFRLGDHARAQTLAEGARRAAETTADVQGLASAHNILGILARDAQEWEAARRHFEQSLALMESQPDPAGRVAALNNLARLYEATGEVGEAQALLEEALTLCERQGDRHRAAALHNNLADLLHASDQSEAAQAHLIQAIQIYADIGRDADHWQPEIWKLTEW